MSTTVQPTIYTTIESYRKFRATIPTTQSIGFVPTMGALHNGHLDLVKYSNRISDITVVSIYVNPTQFAANEDLSKYPSTLQSDINQLSQNNVSHIFIPNNDTMYPNTDPYGNTVQHDTWITNERANQYGEGATRPTHFRGVLTVVLKLFHIIQPHYCIFGQKDGLQCIVIKKMIHDLNIPITMHIVPTHRASDGLALSSRNVYLTKSQRSIAPILYRSLVAVQHEYYDNKQLNKQILYNTVYNILSGESSGALDYINISYSNNGNPVTDDTLSATDEYMVAIAYRLGTTRLIDNCILSPHSDKHRI